MTGFAACLYNQLLKYANPAAAPAGSPNPVVGRIWFRGPCFAEWLAYTHGARIGERRLLPQLVLELAAIGVLSMREGYVDLPLYYAHQGIKRNLVVDGQDHGQELFRKWYCTEAGSFACLSLLARGLTGELVRWCEDTGCLYYTGDLVGWVSRKLEIKGPRRRLVRRLLTELEADGVFTRVDDGHHTYLWFHGFAKHQQAYERDGGNRPTVPPMEERAPAPPAAPLPAAPSPPAPPPGLSPRAGGAVALPQNGELFAQAPVERRPARRSDWFRPPWWLRITAGFPMPKGYKNHAREKEAYGVARLRAREQGTDGDGLAEAVLEAVAWQKGLTTWQRGFAPALHNYLKHEEWLQPRPGPEAFLAPDVQPWQREQALKAQYQREKEAKADQETAERLLRLERQAVPGRYDFGNRSSWENPYLQGLPPEIQRLHDDRIREQIGIMRAAHVKRSGPLPAWVEQFLAAHHRPPRLAAVSDDKAPPSPSPPVPAMFTHPDGSPYTLAQVTSLLAADDPPGARPQPRRLAYSADGQQDKKAVS